MFLLVLCSPSLLPLSFWHSCMNPLFPIPLALGSRMSKGFRVWAAFNCGCCLVFTWDRPFHFDIGDSRPIASCQGSEMPFSLGRKGGWYLVQILLELGDTFLSGTKLLCAIGSSVRTSRAGKELLSGSLCALSWYLVPSAGFSQLIGGYSLSSFVGEYSFSSSDVQA